jgi:hypothetical protein
MAFEGLAPLIPNVPATGGAAKISSKVAEAGRQYFNRGNHKTFYKHVSAVQGYFY